MRIAIHQPQYLPWIPYLAKVAFADTFVLLDDVQFQKGGFQNRTLVPDGLLERFLTVPISRMPLSTRIMDMQISYANPWPQKHIAALSNWLRNVEGGTAVDELYRLIGGDYRNLVELADDTLTWMLKLSGMSTPVVRASAINCSGSKSEYIIAICRALNADTYISGRGASAYQNSLAFQNAGIALAYLDPLDKYSQPLRRWSRTVSAVGSVLELGTTIPGELRKSFALHY